MGNYTETACKDQQIKAMMGNYVSLLRESYETQGKIHGFSMLK
jgi:hypothetical protein